MSFLSDDKNKITVVYKKTGGFCNLLKNLLSCMRIQNYFQCDFYIEDHCMLNKIFDLSIYKKKKKKYNNVIVRKSWRLAIFNSDKNLEKIVNNKFSLMFKDFNDYKFFKNYQYNSIDFLYDNNLFNEIYIDYSNLFNKLEINCGILEEVNDFYKKNFNENTISVNIRSWVDNKSRRDDYFNIEKFYNEIEKYDNGINTFFIGSDDKNICYKIKQIQKDKGKNNIIIYEENKFTDPTIIALIELILLSKNTILIGTYLSTFTEMAFIINYRVNKKIIIV